MSLISEVTSPSSPLMRNLIIQWSLPVTTTGSSYTSAIIYASQHEYPSFPHVQYYWKREISLQYTPETCNGLSISQLNVSSLRFVFVLFSGSWDTE